MVGQHSSGGKEEWEVASVHRFHIFKQNLPQGPLPDTSNRSTNGRGSWSSSNELSRRLSGVPSNTISSMLGHM